MHDPDGPGQVGGRVEDPPHPWPAPCREPPPEHSRHHGHDHQVEGQGAEPHVDARDRHDRCPRRHVTQADHERDVGDQVRQADQRGGPVRELCPDPVGRGQEHAFGGEQAERDSRGQQHQGEHARVELEEADPLAQHPDPALRPGQRERRQEERHDQGARPQPDTPGVQLGGGVPGATSVEHVFPSRVE